MSETLGERAERLAVECDRRAVNFSADRDFTVIAGTLRAIAAENAALKEGRDADMRVKHAAMEATQRAWAERDAATARAATLAEEVEKLRAALQKIAGISNQCTWHAHTRKLAHELQDIIHAALAPAATAPRDAAGGGA